MPNLANMTPYDAAFAAYQMLKDGVASWQILAGLHAAGYSLRDSLNMLSFAALEQAAKR